MTTSSSSRWTEKQRDIEGVFIPLWVCLCCMVREQNRCYGSGHLAKNGYCRSGVESAAIEMIIRTSIRTSDCHNRWKTLPGGFRSMRHPMDLMAGYDPVWVVLVTQQMLCFTTLKQRASWHTVKCGDIWMFRFTSLSYLTLSREASPVSRPIKYCHWNSRSGSDKFNWYTGSTQNMDARIPLFQHALR